jgi:hypothetical protein
MQTMTQRDHFDEIAVLLAQGYVRLRQKRAGTHTSGQHSPDRREISLDAIRQAEPFIGTERISAEGGE